jgi:hypothetical protein
VIPVEKGCSLEQNQYIQIVGLHKLPAEESIHMKFLCEYTIRSNGDNLPFSTITGTRHKRKTTLRLYHGTIINGEDSSIKGSDSTTSIE